MRTACDLTETRFDILEALVDDPGLSFSDLAEALGMRVSHARAACRSLEDRGIIDVVRGRRTSPVVCNATKKGRDLLVSLKRANAILNDKTVSTHPEEQYLDLLRELLTAPPRPDRTGTGTRSVFGRQMRFDLAQGFPLLTTKKLSFRAIALELLWFLRGDTNAKWLEDQGVNIWREWGNPETREMGPIYGAQWRAWAVPFATWKKDGSPYGFGTRHIDQVTNVLQSLRDDPYGRRHIVTAWNPADVPDMALPPCHCLFQFYVEADGRLSCQLYQRSADVFLGVPFNIASYALLTMMFARVLGREPGTFIWSGGDVHLYRDHEQQVAEQIRRLPRPFPTVALAERSDLDTWSIGDFTLSGYDPHAHIAGRVSA